MAAPFIDWSKATVKVTVPVHHTAAAEVQEIDVPLDLLRLHMPEPSLEEMAAESQRLVDEIRRKHETGTL